MSSRNLVFIALCLPLLACGKTSPPGPDTRAAAPATSVPPGGARPHDDHDRGAEHAHQAPHGGMVASAGNYHLEAVVTKVGLVLYLLDADEKELPVEGASGKVLVTPGDGAAPIEAKLAPMGNHLMADVALRAPWSLVVSVSFKGESLSARFESGAGGGRARPRARPGARRPRARRRARRP